MKTDSYQWNRAENGASAGRVTPQPARSASISASALKTPAFQSVSKHFKGKDLAPDPGPCRTTPSHLDEDNHRKTSDFRQFQAISG
jgi:hypothetical protein